MCGIAALFAYHSEAPGVAHGELQAINDHMVRRGPDGEGFWYGPDDRVGLAHRRLAIIDLSATGHQPMSLATQNQRYHITYNGEIYNFHALRDGMEQQGYRFVTQSDTEVLLRLYERDGADMVNRLRGMFALVIWDAQDQALFLARDPFGIKPLYYADDGRTLRAASQVKALLAGGAVERSPEPAGHVGYFLTGSVPEPYTLYKAIKALPAGHWMRIGANGDRKITRYFDPKPALAAPMGDAPPADLRQVLLDSMQAHFIADVPVGLFLSAGLDSTSLAGLAAECQGRGVQSITLGFDAFKGLAMDEVPLAEEVARLYQTDHATRRIGQNDFDAAFDDILDVMDQPSIDGVNTYFVARAAKQQGLKVALSGLGGDELFGGYDTFAQVPALVGKLSPIPAIDSLGRAFRLLSAPWLSAFTSPKAAGLFEYGSHWGGAYLLRRGLYMPWELDRVLDGDMARAGMAELQPVRRLDQLVDGVDEPRRKVGLLETTQYMANQLLRDADWAGMAHSLEIRVPLVDRLVFEQLAPGVHRAGGPSKQKMAATPKTALPASIINRPKTGFAIPVDRWLEERSGTRERGFRGWAQTVYQAANGGTAAS
ncbi:MAG: asparagine synthase (glutamine-hydrolyzing) [Rhodospirillales bacterium]|nr:asparagine synthase (glutamine-hydrolyzing) [Rhodospirillales bacterium]